jgi:hypothetical protein
LATTKNQQVRNGSLVASVLGDGLETSETERREKKRRFSVSEGGSPAAFGLAGELVFGIQLRPINSSPDR